MTSHYFTSNETATKKELRPVQVRVRGLDLNMLTADRVFSSSGLDGGTRVLLDAVPRPPGHGTFLDLGCGWGPVAAVMATESPDAKVWAIDVSERALDLSRRNMTRLKLSNVDCMTEEAALAQVENSEQTFDLIWSNPPVRIGKQPMQALLKRWLGVLSSSGEAYLVISKNLGADSTAKWLEHQGFTVERTTSKKGFRVFRVKKHLES